LFESYPELGYNYRMTDIQAAVGREQLKRLPEIIARRRGVAQRYRELLADIPGLVLPSEPPYARSNWQSFCVRLPDHCDQRGIMQQMLDKGVSTRRGIMCSHREPAYAGHTLSQPLPRSEEAQDRAVILPLYPQMADEDIIFVSRCLREACSPIVGKVSRG
jgi:dTDP-4-amino-4,6-dideoxygalactose transaminase